MTAQHDGLKCFPDISGIETMTYWVQRKEITKGSQQLITLLHGTLVLKCLPECAEGQI
jgi:hypothetical protein